MSTPNASEAAAGTAARPPRLKVFGVGSAGIQVLEQIASHPLPDAVCLAVGTSAESLAASSAGEKVLLESHLVRGLGTGGDPERGQAVAEDNVSRLRSACEGAEVIFVVAGLGGGAGTGVSPVLARVAKETGALVLAFVTLPFDCEGNRRRNQAFHGWAQLKTAADGVICLPNQKILRLIDDQTSVRDTFKRANELLAEGVGGVWRLMSRKGLIEIHFADLCAQLRDRHSESSFASAEAEGPARSRELVEKLLAHPLLDSGKTLAEADAVLVSLAGGPELSMTDINRVMEQLTGSCPRAQVTMGAAIDESLRERLAVTVIATRRSESAAAKAAFDEAADADGSFMAERPESEYLSRSSTARAQSRFVPPPPSLPPEKVQQLMARQSAGTGRQRKSAAKMRQGQLPLEIVSKGRFDKSEPTIHKGEDLDVPTYIRRGIPLN